MAASEKRQIEVDLLARNKMGPGARAAADDLDKVGKAAGRAADSAEDMGKASAIAGDGAEKLGKDSNQAQRYVDQLGDEIRKVEQDLVLLAGAFAEADNAAARLDVSKGIRKSQNELRRLKTSKGILEGILPDPEPAARSFMTKLGGALLSGGAQLASLAGKGPGGLIGASMAAAAAPVLISGIGSALSAGAGAGVIGAGIALAVSKDAGIKQAGANMGKKFIGGLQDSALKNFKGPIQTSMNILGDAGDRVTKKWDATFKSLSGSIVPLTQDIVTGVERINESVTDAASKSQPAIKGMGDAWVLLADGAGDALDALSSGSNAAAGNLVVLSGVTADLLRISTNTLGVFGKLSESAWVTGPLLPLLKKYYGDTAAEAKKFSDATSGAAGAMTDAELAARGNADGLAALNTELKKQADPVFALRESQVKLADAQKNAAEATKKHGANSKEARAATRKLAEAALDLQGNVGRLGKDFDGKLTPAMRSTLEAAGLTKKEVDAVEKEFGAARKAGNAYAKTYTARTKINGAEAVRRSLYTIKELEDGIDRTIHIAMKITGTKNASAALSAYRKNAEGRASGGPVEAGRPYWVGEEGPELIMPTAAGHVLNAAKSRSLMMGGQNVPGPGAGYRHVAGLSRHLTPSGHVPTVRVDVTGAEGKFKAWIREMYRTGELP